MRAVLRHYMELEDRMYKQWEDDCLLGYWPQNPFTDEVTKKFDKVAQMCGYNSWCHFINTAWPPKDFKEVNRGVGLQRHRIRAQQYVNSQRYFYYGDTFTGVGVNLSYFIQTAMKHHSKKLKVWKNGQLILDRE